MDEVEQLGVGEEGVFLVGADLEVLLGRLALALPGRSSLALVRSDAILLRLALGAIIVDKIVLIRDLFVAGGRLLVAFVASVLEVPSETHQAVVLLGLLVDLGIAVGRLDLPVLEGGRVGVAVEGIGLLLHHPEEVLLELDEFGGRAGHEFEDALHLGGGLQAVDEVKQEVFVVVGDLLHEEAVQDGQRQLLRAPLAVRVVVALHPHHFQRQDFHQPFFIQPDIFRR